MAASIILENAIVQITTSKFTKDLKFPFQPGQHQESSGSGFFFVKEKPLLLTCAHVIENALSISICIPHYGKKVWDAEVLSVCPVFDLALLRIKNFDKVYLKKMNHLEIDKDGIKHTTIGDKVHAVGYPLGQTNLKVTEGIISGHQFNFYQVDSPINPGNSGGPLLRKNKVIGITNAGIPFANDIGYAVPIEAFLNLKSFFLKPVPIIHVPQYWGFQYHQQESDKTGVVVYNILPHSIASRASQPLKPHDILVRLGKYKVLDTGETSYKWMNGGVTVNDLLYHCKFPSKVRYEVLRPVDGKEKFQRIRGHFDVDIEKTVPGVPKYFFPIETMDHFVGAGAVFIPLCRNIISDLNYYFHDELDDERQDDQAYSSKNKRITNGTALQLLEAFSLTKRYEPRVFISNVLQGSLLHKKKIFQSGDLVYKINGKIVSTIDDVKKAFGSKSKLLTIESAEHKIFQVEKKKMEEEEKQLREQYKY